MTSIKSLIKNEVAKALINENLANFDQFHSGISRSSEIGKEWIKLIYSLESIVNEVKDFSSLYPPSTHGPTPNITEAMTKLKQIAQLLVEIKPIILGMDDIQKKDI